jgi:hypothetical protein
MKLTGMEAPLTHSGSLGVARVATSFLHSDCATVQLTAVHGLDCSGAVVKIDEGNKSKTTGSER